MGTERLELSTFAMSPRRSSHLNYVPNCILLFRLLCFDDQQKTPGPVSRSRGSICVFVWGGLQRREPPSRAAGVITRCGLRLLLHPNCMPREHLFLRSRSSRDSSLLPALYTFRWRVSSRSSRFSFPLPDGPGWQGLFGPVTVSAARPLLLFSP